MTDAYRAIYDAATLQLGHLSYIGQHIQQEVYLVSSAMTAPHVLMRPSIGLDGNQWCALYGDDLQNGVAGFGDTPALAMAAFDKAWVEDKAPGAAANAHRRMAAPELLASCQWLKAYAEVQVRNHPDAEDTPQWASLLSAIAKATGEASA